MPRKRGGAAGAERRQPYIARSPARRHAAYLQVPLAASPDGSPARDPEAGMTQDPPEIATQSRDRSNCPGAPQTPPSLRRSRPRDRSRVGFQGAGGPAGYDEVAAYHYLLRSFRIERRGCAGGRLRPAHVGGESLAPQYAQSAGDIEHEIAGSIELRGGLRVCHLAGAGQRIRGAALNRQVAEYPGRGVESGRGDDRRGRVRVKVTP